MAAKMDDTDLSHSQLNAGDVFYDLCCTPCTGKSLNKQASKYCTGCKQYLCVGCIENHNSFPGLLGHVMMDPNVAKPSPSTSGEKYQEAPTEMCKIHELKPMDMFCRNDNVVGCSVCITLKHRSCDDIHYIPQFVQSNFPAEQVYQVNNNLTKSIEAMKKLMTQHDRLDDNLEKSKATCKQEIQNYREDLNQIINTIEATTLTELDASHKDIKQKTNDRHQNIQDVHDIMVRFKSEIESDQSNDSQKFVIAKLSQRTIMQCQELQSELPHDQITELTFTRNTNIMTFLWHTVRLGILSPPEIQDSSLSTITTSSYQPQQTQSIISSHQPQQTQSTTKSDQPQQTQSTTKSHQPQQTQSTTKSHQPQQTQSTTSSHQPQPTQSSTKSHQPPQTQSSTRSHQPQQTQSSTSSHQPQQTQSSASPSTSGENRNNTNVSTGQQDTTVTMKPLKQGLYKVSDKRTYNIQHPDDDNKTCCIWSSCILDNGDILLVDSKNKKLKLVDHRTYTIRSTFVLKSIPESVCRVSSTEAAVCKYDRTIQFVSTHGGKLIPVRTLSMKHNCSFVAVMRDKMYVCDKQSIYIYTSTGELVKNVRKDASGIFSLFSKDIFSDIRDITVSDDEKIHVADWQNGVITLNTDGNVVWRYAGTEPSGARGVCTDGNGNVIVCGYGSHNVIHNVIQLSPDGRYMGEIATCSDGVPYPRTVCYDRTNHKLIVGQLNNNKITVFTVQ